MKQIYSFAFKKTTERITLELLQKALELALSITVFVEAAPLWWKSIGCGLVTTLFASWGVYTVRLMVEVIFLRLGFNLVEWVTALVFRFLPTVVATAIRRFLKRYLGWVNHGRLWQKIVTFLRRLGYFGLFAAGLIPVPGLGMTGLFIYNLEQFHKPWYRFDNFAFVCLLGGGLIKMSLVVGATYHDEVMQLWHSLIK